MREAVIVSTARTPIAKAYRGALNLTKSPTMAAHAINGAIDRSGIDPAEIEDLVFGTVMNGGTAGNVARMGAIAAGLPVSVPAQNVDRQCSSGLMAIADAAKQIIVDGSQIVVAGGQENITAVQAKHVQWTAEEIDPNVTRQQPHAYMPMIETAEYVSRKYRISRESQDEYSLLSQQRTAAAQQRKLFEDEIVPITVAKGVVDRETKEVSYQEFNFDADECNRPSTTIKQLAALAPVIDGGFITAGNASQLSDGASACVLVESAVAAQKGLQPLGAYRGMAVVGNEPEEMGIGPIYAIPKLLKQHGLKIDDIDLWELNEAFACQALYCRDYLGIDPEKYNVNGGSISIGHPYGMTGARCAGHLLLEGRRRNAKFGVVSMCCGSGMGAAALFEIF